MGGFPRKLSQDGRVDKKHCPANEDNLVKAGKGHRGIGMPTILSDARVGF